MDRREALRAVGLIMGGTVIGAQAFLSGCQSEKEDRQVNKLFTESDIKLLDEVGDTIIPETDTPGAKAVGIGSFIGMMVLDVYTERDQQTFKEGLEELRSGFEESYGHSFMEGTAKERHEYLSKLNEELVALKNVKRNNDQPEPYFRMIKELTLLGYFSSEIGSTQALRYIETPGRYDGCVPYEKGDRAWAI